MIGFKLNLHKQSGQSMVEMLGVLSIIGILSMAALLGYNYAVAKYKANRTLSELGERAVAGITKLTLSKETLSGEFQLEEFANVTSMGYMVTQSILDESHFDITLEQVPLEVYRLLIEGDSVDFSAIYVNGKVSDQTKCSKENKMIFEVGDGMSVVERCETNADCTRSCDSSQNGVCKSNCPSGKKCVITATTTLEKYQCCFEEKILDGICCSKVKDNGDGQKLCCTYNDKCCPSGYFDPYPASQSQCLPCDAPGDYEVWSSNHIAINDDICLVCPNRVMNGWRCSLECKSGTHLNPITRRCVCDNPDNMQDKYGNCYTCDEATSDTYIWLWQDDNRGCYECNYRPGGGYCFKCPHGTVAVKDGSGVGASGKCVACPDDVSELPSKHQCLSCDGTWNDDTKKCEK